MATNNNTHHTTLFANYRAESKKKNSIHNWLMNSAVAQKNLLSSSPNTSYRLLTDYSLQRMTQPVDLKPMEEKKTEKKEVGKKIQRERVQNELKPVSEIRRAVLFEVISSLYTFQQRTNETIYQFRLRL